MYNTKVNVNIWDKTHLDALFYVFKLIIIHFYQPQVDEFGIEGH